MRGERSDRIWQEPGRLLMGAGGLVAVPLLASLAWKWIRSDPHSGQITSRHWDGERFRNQVPLKRQGLRDFLRWQFGREQGEWDEWTDMNPGPPPVRQVALGEMRVTLVGHSTALIQMDGLNILTDPIWSDRASPVSWAGPKRVCPPGIRFEDLPPIDAVLISHNHYDHLDLPTLRRLEEEHAPRFYVGLGNEALLRQQGIREVVEMDWWDMLPLGDQLTVTATPAQHFSARGLFDRQETLWMGFVLRGPSGTAYFAGDTGWGPHFEQVRERFGRVRLALLPIGAYKPRWFMGPVHISPEEAVDAHEILDAGTSVAIHHGTFDLADDGQREPVRDLHASLTRKQVPTSRFWTPAFGEGRSVPPLEGRASGLS